ncbi:internalin A [Rhodoblastus acidophilus]|uniref:leucine-rich repeat domain-containing protein n=1 Tax=Rhodoblastus acidophilus TaxID=1074 RepID=UPI0022256EAF|nr:leucine-rich repeat domain-containing protein [Rhodoblastus acidophilus]MCW2284841.1 internalin A [Rhodoblastus acidophilus]MCW2333869.1 internalin A [Rhodoblastus acidophilus]
MRDGVDGREIARERIAREAEARTGTLDLAGLGLTEIPAEIGGLTHLRELDIGAIVGENDDYHESNISDLAPLSRLTTLQSLDCWSTQVVDLAPLAGLTALRSLDCSSTQVANLAPLTGLTTLQSLRCWDTKVADLTPLAGLIALQYLKCWGTHVADLAPLARLKALQTLDCSSGQVADLAPLARMNALKSLDCSYTQVADLAPLARLKALQTLNCSYTQVANLAPLARLKTLQTLNCSDTQVADLAPLARLKTLQTLNCSDTQVADLAPLARLKTLQTLNCSDTQVADLAPLTGLAELSQLEANGCRLAELRRIACEAPSLENLKLWRSRAPDIPTAILSANDDENCLPALRAYFAESGPCDAVLEDVKLMVLGNGRVGKTQLCNVLMDKPYQPDSDSTHGVVVARHELKRRGGAPLPLHIWDFGGQDIFHGTHALFLRDHAIFALVWAEKLETAAADPKDARFGNRPLPYWLDYVRHASGTDNAVVAVQTRCDAPRDEAKWPVDEEALKQEFGYFNRVNFSAAKPRGVAALSDALSEAAEYALEQEGAPKIPEAWARVKRALEGAEDADALRPVARRRHRVLTTKIFARLCRRLGVKSEPTHLLSYLHRTGVVFHRPDLTDRIVLDQSWALEAIYAVFDRAKGTHARILRQNGRFRPSELAVSAWSDRSDGDRSLFLDMMRACGVCFEIWEDDGELELVAPELLPERAAVEAAIRRDWETGQEIRARTYKFPFLHDGLIRAVIAKIGREARANGTYWRDGVSAFETGTGARVLIEQNRGADWSGEIRISTRGGQADALLASVCKELERMQERFGLKGEVLAPAEPARETAPEETRFGRDPKAPPRAYVSYAWADESDRRREEKVDALCEAADKRKWEVRRDKNVLTRADSISDFMREIGAGERVFVFLSHKYLRSPFCMFELFEVWRQSRRDDEEFRRRVRLFVLDDAKIWSLKDRLAHAKYWRAESQELGEELKTSGPDLLSKNDYEAYRRMGEFATQIGDILEAFASRVQVKNFDEFLRWGFDDPTVSP